MKKKVSVCVLTYNYELYLSDCLDSILAQSYDNLEIIISDDCSTDNTKIIIENYKRKYHNKFIVNINTSNLGVTANSNKALFLCTGHYVCFIGGDDIMIKNKILEQVNFLEENIEYNLCYHDIELFDSRTGQKISKVSDFQKSRIGDIKTLLKHGPFNGGISNMIRASSIPSEGFDDRVKIASDWLFYCSCLLPFGKIGYINKVLVRQRRGEYNVTNTTPNNEKRIKLAYEDHILSCGILLHRYPIYALQIKYRISSLLRESRIFGSYSNYVVASLIFKFNLKSLLAFLKYK